jgi:hypothetical protein
MYTPWRYHQYFEVIKGHFWVREMLFKYVRLLGADSAYACNEYMAENNRKWEEEKMTFDKWERNCLEELQHKIRKLDIQDVLASNELFYNGDPVYFDDFSDAKLNVSQQKNWNGR